jgi:hypothetical protein
MLSASPGRRVLMIQTCLAIRQPRVLPHASGLVALAAGTPA